VYSAAGASWVVEAGMGDRLYTPGSEAPAQGAHEGLRSVGMPCMLGALLLTQGLHGTPNQAQLCCHNVSPVWVGCRPAAQEQHVCGMLWVEGWDVWYASLHLAV
jgi:hypothetical protein